MAKLVDALVSGTSVSNDVQVRVLFWAHNRRAKDKSHRDKRNLALIFILLSFILILAQMVKLVDTPA